MNDGIGHMHNIAIQTIKDCEIESYGRNEIIMFLKVENRRELTRGLSEEGGGIDATVPKAYALRVNRCAYRI